MNALAINGQGSILRRIRILLAGTLLITACSKSMKDPLHNAIDTGSSSLAINSYNLLRGADISFLTEMENKGRVFFNTTDQQDLFTILKERNINAIRLRVWVNPAGPNYYNGIADVVNKAVRAKNAGMKLLIDFHYSDYWADPKQQNIPAAWAGNTLTQMKTAIEDHTTGCLTALAASGVTPEFVQIGNEVDSGMLWPMGVLPANMSNFAQLYKAGYTAVKDFNPAIKVIVHFSRSTNNQSCKNILNGLISNQASFDVIGLSVYPTSNYASVMSSSFANMQDLVNVYNKDIVVAECGYFQWEPRQARTMIETLISNVNSLPGNHGLGVYYWEPESYDHSAPNRSIFHATLKNPTVGMDGFSYIKNPGFELDTTAVTNPTGWTTTGSNPDANYTEINPHTGSFRLTHWKSSAYNVATSQTITGLSNGLYTFQAWVVSPATMVSNYLFVKDHGGAQINQHITVGPGWKKVKIGNINVTNGQCTIGLQTAGNATYCSMDDVEFWKQ
jgi:arabinogalactan endo-1,4-beta-galactosidase